MNHNIQSKVRGIGKKYLNISLVFLTFIISLGIVSAGLGLSDPDKPKLEAPETSAIVININDSTLNVNNSDYLDGYDSSAFAKLNENNAFTGIQTINNIVDSDGHDILVVDNIIDEIDIGNSNDDLILYGNSFNILNVLDSNGAMINYYKNLFSLLGANITSNYFKGNGSLLTGVCLSNGTNCQSSGFTNGSNIWIKSLGINTNNPTSSLEVVTSSETFTSTEYPISTDFATNNYPIDPQTATIYYFDVASSSYEYSTDAGDNYFYSPFDSHIVGNIDYATGYIYTWDWNSEQVDEITYNYTISDSVSAKFNGNINVTQELIANSANIGGGPNIYGEALHVSGGIYVDTPTFYPGVLAWFNSPSGGGDAVFRVNSDSDNVFFDITPSQVTTTAHKTGAFRFGGDAGWSGWAGAFYQNSQYNVGMGTSAANPITPNIISFYFDQTRNIYMNKGLNVTENVTASNFMTKGLVNSTRINTLNVTALNVFANNLCYSNGTNCISGGDNSSWNESRANLLYAPISSGGDNSSWNETRANTLYSNIQWNYNQSTPFYNWLSSFVYNYNQSLIYYNNPLGYYNISSAPTYLNDTWRNNYTNYYNKSDIDNNLSNYILLSSLPLENKTKIAYQNITNIPTCSGTDKLTYSAGVLSCATDQTGGSSKSTIYKSDLTSLNATGLTFTTLFTIPLTAQKNYTINCIMYHSSNATTSGIRYNMTLAGVPDFMSMSEDAYTTATAKQGSVVFGASQSLMPTAITASLTYPAFLNDEINIFIDGNANTGGDAIFQFSGELAGLRAIIGRGSYCELEETN